MHEREECLQRERERLEIERQKLERERMERERLERERVRIEQVCTFVFWTSAISFWSITLFAVAVNFSLHPSTQAIKKPAKHYIIHSVQQQ